MSKSQEAQKIQRMVYEFIGNHPEIIQIIIDFINKYPDLEVVVPPILKTYLKLVDCFDSGHKLFICGNGGSFADSMHISTELMKSFLRKRNLTNDDKKIFENLPHGKELSQSLEYGFPTIVLGLNHSLYSALENDISMQNIGFAQELYNLAHQQDILMAISTSGQAKNVIYATIVAKAKSMTTIALTGEKGGELAKLVDIAIKVPDSTTIDIQELHLPVYHAICAIIEAHYFKELR